MLPGFIDSHGHVVFGGLQALSANLLAPPDGPAMDIASLQATLSEWANENADAVDQVNMIVGFGYDNAQLAELRHPTRQDLDEVSEELPIIVVHQSGHLGVANSKALENAGIDASSEPPPGGVIRKDANGDPTGVLEEYAFFAVLVPMLAELGPEGLAEFGGVGAPRRPEADREHDREVDARHPDDERPVQTRHPRRLRSSSPTSSSSMPSSENIAA